MCWLYGGGLTKELGSDTATVTSTHPLGFSMGVSLKQEEPPRMRGIFHLEYWAKVEALNARNPSSFYLPHSPNSFLNAIMSFTGKTST